MAGSLYTLALLLCVALQATAQTLIVTKAGTIGTGCQPGSAVASVKCGAVRLDASDFSASAGPGVSYSSNRKNCQATLSVDIPEGYQFALGETKLPAQVQTGNGVQVSVGSEYYFQGDLTKDQSSTIFPAGTSGAVIVVNSYTPSSWSSCGGTAIVNINTALRASNSNDKSASGSIRLRGSVDTKIVWKKC